MVTRRRPFFAFRFPGFLSVLFGKVWSDVFAMASLAFSLFLWGSLFSYHPDDPCWNVATLTESHNWFGAYGAFWADALVQWIGPGAFVFSALWVWIFFRLVERRPLKITPWVCGILGASYAQAAGLLVGPLAILIHPLLDMGSTPAQMSAPYPNALPVVLDTVLEHFFSQDAMAWGKLGLFWGGIVGALGYIGFLILRWKKQRGHSLRFFAFFSRSRKRTSKPSSPSYSEVSTPSVASENTSNLLDLAFTPGEFSLPPLSLLQTPTLSKQDKSPRMDQDLQAQLTMLQSVLEDFGIRGKVLKAHPGPIVTLYELEPAAGVKSSRIISLSDDIARSMSVLSARVAVIPGKNLIGIELANQKRETVHLKELLASSDYLQFSGALALTLGKNISGDPVVVDLTKMPHVLVAGTTGSGKSVGINSMILSLLYHLSPKQCRFIMIDPKMLELSLYEGIPHLLAPVITEPAKAIIALKWVVQEMENRYRLMSQLGVRNITSYNQKIQQAERQHTPFQRNVQMGFDTQNKPIFETHTLEVHPFPFIVVIIDEMADLMLVAGKDLEILVQRLAQMARAAGIHLIMATQRPSVDVITGTIKANFPTRISFQVTSKIDSRTILGEQGAEHLLGQGDLLYMASGGRITRVHGPFVSDEEIERVVGFLKTQGDPDYIEMRVQEDPMTSDETFGGSEDDLYRQALDVIRRDGRISTSYLQRQLQIGYNRAAGLVDRMEREGVVSPPNHSGKREIIN